ncbi:HAD family hydrolase [Amphibiibacter pelophylacis]|uniref:HAD-IA family hydrolase n=1 Tax=Amphibiibacter pelophylacis TaxID=1799477 RepID=A0ACC6P3D8_9BURK
MPLNRNLPTSRPDAVFFDLDGTLIDSAPDLAGAANTLRRQRALEPLPFEALRPQVSNGARGLVGVALGLTPDDDGYEAARVAFLAAYETGLLNETRPFPGVPELLQTLHDLALPWGIMTNKHTRYARPVVAGLRALDASRVLVCGDTTAHPKPHPAPLLHCAEALGVAPQRCVYVGDDLRDIQAAHAAGMVAVAAAWGYLGDSGPIEGWGANHIARSPQDLADWLRDGPRA